MTVQAPLAARKKRRVALSAVLVALAVLSVAIGFSYAYVSSYQVQKAQVVKNTLAYGRAYADKLAGVVNIYIHAMHGQLQSTASKLAVDMRDQTDLAGELERVVQHADGAIAMLLADADGNVMVSATKEGAPSPRSLAELGVRELRVGEWVSIADSAVPTLTLVEPVNLADGGKPGFLALVVALEDRHGIAQVVGNVDEVGGMAVYVVSKMGDVLYRRQSDFVPTNLKDVSRTVSGWAEPLKTDEGRTLLTAYAPIEKGNWAVVTQQPLDAALLPVRALLLDALRSAAPVLLIILLLVSALAYAIAAPLSRLSRALNGGPGAQKDLDRLNAWYAEADTLRGAVAVTLAQHRQQMTQLNRQSMTDPLTGLMNRRALDEAMAAFKTESTAVAVIALDLDHFKRINDTFGHASGDKVLVAVADALRHSLRGQDKPYRVGGEEFIALLPSHSAQVARDVAARIRAALAAQTMPDGVGKVSASAGIALWPGDGATLEEVLERADEALYASKQAGRDRITLWADVATERRQH